MVESMYKRYTIVSGKLGWVIVNKNKTLINRYKRLR